MTVRDPDKSALRHRFSSLRDSLQGEMRTAAESAILERLFALPAWEKAPLVCGYMSMRVEIGMTPVWKQAAAEGRAYALPVTVTGAKEGRMVFRRTEAFSPRELVPARFGVSEPPDTWPELSLRELEGALIIVPGLAFDGEGFRIGYGGGYYDRFLAALRDAHIPVTAVGLVFEACRTPELPRGPYDMPVDFVIDERRMTVTHGIRT